MVGFDNVGRALNLSSLIIPMIQIQPRSAAESSPHKPILPIAKTSRDK